VCGSTLTGILSYSVNCGTQNKPSVYTDVAQHSAWIKQIISTAPGGGGDCSGGIVTARDSMSYVTISAMLAALSSLWSCRT